MFAGRSFHKIKHMLNMGPVCVWNQITCIMRQSTPKKPNLNLFFFPLASWNPFKCNQQKVKKKQLKYVSHLGCQWEKQRCWRFNRLPFICTVIHWLETAVSQRGGKKSGSASCGQVSSRPSVQVAVKEKVDYFNSGGGKKENFPLWRFKNKCQPLTFILGDHMQARSSSALKLQL